MKCLKPTIAWKHGTHVSKDGRVKNTILFSPNEAMKRMTPAQLEVNTITIPCGKCEACLRAKRSEQALRIIHEVEAHEDNCFITLTYNNENLPWTDGETTFRRPQDDSRMVQIASGRCRPTLCLEDYQKWLKRLRKKIMKEYGKTIRYFIVGEYGPKGQRPHYHAIIFGWKPDDCIEHRFCNSYWTYRSKFIEETWTLGFSEVGLDVNSGVAKYCANYVTKKFDKEDRPNDLVHKEFVRCSKMNGGLGASFVRQFHKQIAEQGYVFVLDRRTGNGWKQAIPRYYKALLEKEYAAEFDILQQNKECYVEAQKTINGSMSPKDWEKYWKDYFEKVKVWKENHKREKRKFEDPETMYRSA